MATFISQSSTTGFYRAPVCKGLILVLISTFIAINIPLLSHLREYLACPVPEVLQSGQIWRLLTSRLAFYETKDFVFGGLLIYYFRIFERRLGSHRFASSLLATTIISLILETTAISLLQTFTPSDLHDGMLPPGPWGLIFSLFVPFICDIPRTDRARFLGVPITGKTLTYLVGFQVCATSFTTILSAACAIVAGLLHRSNFLKLRSWLVIPGWLSSTCSLTLGWLLASSPPPDEPMGATLELQRQEQMERLEQQILLQRTFDARRRQQVGQGYAERLIAGVQQQQQQQQYESIWPADYDPGMDLSGHPNRPPDDVEPSAQNLSLLTSMGFGRDQALHALQRTGDNVEAATHFLLQQQFQQQFQQQ